jgi:hypothetical protein
MLSILTGIDAADAVSPRVIASVLSRFENGYTFSTLGGMRK